MVGYNPYQFGKATIHVKGYRLCESVAFASFSTSYGHLRQIRGFDRKANIKDHSDRLCENSDSTIRQGFKRETKRCVREAFDEKGVCRAKNDGDEFGFGLFVWMNGKHTESIS